MLADTIINIELSETVVDALPSAEVDAGLIDILDRNDVAQKEHALLIEIQDHAGFFATALAPLVY